MKKKDYINVSDICKRIISKISIEPILPQLEPDIIGESFFLLFIKDVKRFSSKTFEPSFIDMLSIGDDELKTQDALEFVGFITRLVRNLSNDDQDDETTKKLWLAFFSFMRPNKFPEDSKMRWAISAALMEVFDSLKKIHPEKIENILKAVDVVSLYDNRCPELLDLTLVPAMTHFMTPPMRPVHL